MKYIIKEDGKNGTIEAAANGLTINLVVIIVAP